MITNSKFHMQAWKAILLSLAVLTGCVMTLQFEEKWITAPPTIKRFSYSMYIVTSRATDRSCTGSLVAAEWVLTAARCMFQGLEEIVEDDTSLTVYAGVTDISNLTDPSIQKRKSLKLIIHEQHFYSLALIMVDIPFNISEQGLTGVEVITLSRIESSKVEDLYCESGSFGSRSNNETTLKHLDLEEVDCKCHKELKSYFSGEDESLVCGVSTLSDDICGGDLGVGMVCDGNLQAVMVGMVSYQDQQTCVFTTLNNFDRGNVKITGLYKDVCYYLVWIGKYVSDVQETSEGCGSLSAKDKRPSLVALLCFLTCLWFSTSFKLIIK